MWIILWSMVLVFVEMPHHTRSQREIRMQTSLETIGVVLICLDFRLFGTTNLQLLLLAYCFQIYGEPYFKPLVIGTSLLFFFSLNHIS